MTDFSARIACVLSMVPAGKTVTYGQLAALCGKPRCARLAGHVLGTGVSPYAYKTVGAGGRLSGAAAFRIPGLQAEMLRAEGVVMLPGERVDLAKSGWIPADEELERLKELFAKKGI